MKATVETCRANKLRDGYIRLVVTRGIGTLGLNPRSCKKPSVIIIAGKIQVYPAELYARGMDIVTVPTVRNLHSARQSGHQVAELSEQHPRQDRGEQRRRGGGGDVERRRLCGRMHGGQSVHRQERRAAHAAAFGGRALRHHAATVMELARAAGMRVSEPNLTRYDLFNADECFLTGTGAEIMPVMKIDGRVIGTGKPGTAHAQADGKIPRLDESLRRADIEVE